MQLVLSYKYWNTLLEPFKILILNGFIPRIRAVASLLPHFLVRLCFPFCAFQSSDCTPTLLPQTDPAQAHMQCENCSIVLENLWEGQERGMDSVQRWGWLGNQIHGSASKGTGSLCSAYWSPRNVAGLLGFVVNYSCDIWKSVLPSHRIKSKYLSVLCETMSKSHLAQIHDG